MAAVWREASGRERKRSFARMTDARRFLVGVEDSKLRGAYVPPEAGRDVFVRTVYGALELTWLR